MNIIITAIKFIILLCVITIIHEGGHFLIARLFSVKVNEFSIGFGKKIFSKQGKNTNFFLRLIPLGGYAMMAEGNGKDIYDNKSVVIKICILLAGGIFNIIFGLLIYFMLFTFTNNVYSLRIDKVENLSPAYYSGLKEGDYICKIDDKTLNIVSDFSKIINEDEKQVYRLTYVRDNIENDILIKPTKNENNIKTAGITFTLENWSLKSALKQGYYGTISFSESLVQNIKRLFTGSININEFIGPIGITNIVAKSNGVINYIYIISLISLSVGITNLLPLVPLDGGKIILLIIEKITRRKISKTQEASISFAGFLVILLFSIYIAFNDVLKYLI